MFIDIATARGSGKVDRIPGCQLLCNVLEKGCQERSITGRGCEKGSRCVVSRTGAEESDGEEQRFIGYE